jgi:hypothetical protein
LDCDRDFLARFGRRGHVRCRRHVQLIGATQAATKMSSVAERAQLNERPATSFAVHLKAPFALGFFDLHNAVAHSLSLNGFVESSCGCAQRWAPLAASISCALTRTRP